MRQARPDEAVTLHALRESAARWLTDAGIRQWVPGEVGLDEVREQVRTGQWWVRAEDHTVAGACRLLAEDPEVWGDRPGDALYVHGLVVDRAHAGHGLGAAMLDWAGQVAAADGRGELRLDCVESNDRLRRYYAGLGFAEVGRVVLDDPRWFPTVLLTRPAPVA